MNDEQIRPDAQQNQVVKAAQILETAADRDDRYRLLVESIVDYAIYMLDPQGNIASWNPGAQRFKGYTTDEIIGQHFSQFYTEEDRATDLPARALHIAATDGRFEQEGWRVRKDGSLMWAHVLIDPIRSPDGQLVGYAKITRDLSERKATQDALKQSEQRFRLLVQGVQDYAIYMLDPHGAVSSWNRGAHRFKGYTDEEIIGQHFSRFYTEEDRATGLPARALQTAATEGRFEAEGWRVRKDGTRFWAHVVIDAIRGDHGELVGFAKITRDVTERRNVQQELEATRARFIQSQKMEAIGQLTGGVAHDFNNLLAVVLGNLSLARKRLPNDPKLLQLIENSIQAAERGATLTKRMLAFARRQELTRGPVDVPELVRGMAELLQRSISSNIPVSTRFPLRLPLAFVDASQLELALLNLTVNARDAMPDGGSITISAREERISTREAAGLPAGSYVCLSVTDTGMGMSEETLAKATEPFFTTKGVGKGTGLGLSMIHGFAGQSGGRLVLKSTLRQGTTAELWLPVAEANLLRQEDETPHPDLPILNPMTVLVVDDDPLVLMNISAMLEDLGHEVLEATSGQQALRILRRSAEIIDLVITDQIMPGMTGVQLIEAIRAAHLELPVILASGYTELPEGKLTGLVRLGKPFEQADLARALVTIMRPSGEVLPFRPKQS
ncbi:hybrid sensor histidine kinase/response regulator [Methylobacterium sp. Leaf118]|uniref:hybrid sensor histidine kinase/response regulator n=1 Tax=Methylobacterium sp. Leaf118 TaxID=2876562 RepID=UPI001E56E11B|nr:PAS domain-containing sensor histidine kinase [Methylobacterium sp. Leaf118]